MTKLRTRFAPSPTGLLHVGNAYSALCCAQWAEQHDAELLLRIEDIDHTRCRPEFASAIIRDLQWLGIRWDSQVVYQHEHLELYQSAIQRLRTMDVLYPCFCTRRDIQQEARRMGLAPHLDDPAALYPGSCRRMPAMERRQRMQCEPFSWRLHAAQAMSLATQKTGEPLSWVDLHGRHHPVHLAHDMIVGRKDIGFSYHLAVVVDDARQGITHVIRGRDLESSTSVQRILQILLDLPEPVYLHHPLLLDARGKRLAKRHGATTLESLRQLGVDAAQLRDFLLNKSHGCWPFDSEEEILSYLAAPQNKPSIGCEISN